MMPGLLLVPHVAEHFGVSSQTVRRWLDEGRLPGVRISRRLVRIDASSVHDDERPAVPPGPSHVDATWVAEAWSMHRRTVLGLADAGVLHGSFVGRRWSFRRADLSRFLDEHRVERAA